MERRYLKDLKKWKDDPYRKPLIVWGARQVGKTYLIKDIFAERYYGDKYIYIDCNNDPEFCNYCETHSSNDVLNYISLRSGKSIDNSTLLIFDEVQECPVIIMMMKYFCQDHREIPIIATGSMVRIRIKRKKRGASDKGFLFPVGKINEITITPLSFDEYLYNRNRIMYDTIVEHYGGKKPIDNVFHEMAMKIFYEYLLIGGMPESVSTFLDTESFQKSRTVLKELYDNYLGDMELYQASPESVIRARAIFSNIYTLLNRESKNFSPSLIEKGARTRDMVSPLDWLNEAHVVNICRRIEGHVTLPLTSTDNTFRLYLCDVGMFSYQSPIDPTSFITDNGRNMLAGIFYETFAAQELRSRGLDLFYWQGKRNSEFEFILGKRGTAIPVDVKKGKGSMNSLKTYREMNSIDYAVKVSRNNYGFDEEQRILTIPFYELFLFADDMASDSIPEDFIERAV